MKNFLVLNLTLLFASIEASAQSASSLELTPTNKQIIYSRPLKVGRYSAEEIKSMSFNEQNNNVQNKTTQAVPNSQNKQAEQNSEECKNLEIKEAEKLKRAALLKTPQTQAPNPAIYINNKLTNPVIDDNIIDKRDSTTPDKP